MKSEMEPDLSDPKCVIQPPAHAVGFPDRSADIDVRPGFVSPPPGYGDVAFYWWLGDPLEKDRIQWHIDQLADKGVMGLQINYAHGDEGGRWYGLTYESDPNLFSKDWWELFKWFIQAAKSKGMAVSLSDYTLGFGQGYYVDEILRENPDLTGATLSHSIILLAGGIDQTLDTVPNLISIIAYQMDGDVIIPDSGIDLRDQIKDNQIRWNAPAGQWKVCLVWFELHQWSLDPMNQRTGLGVIEKFFQRFENAAPDECGKALNFFFSDELTFGVDGNLWNANIADEFKKRNGYDLTAELPALFIDIGPRTPKIRLDYRDVMVSLSEENYFKPIFDWHQQRGMIYGCDHGGRGRRVDEFGDYFRTQRWNQGPGSDQPRLRKDLIIAKVAASIAHLYQRPRVWIEGFYSSGWGTSSAQIADATFANFAHGYNLLTLHGLYYSTHGGYWEWAPPCNHFHMPYWNHMGTFMECVQRLSYLLSQGHHVCDVGIIYPVAPTEAGMAGQESVDCAFSVARSVYENGIDFDFIDFQSINRAEIHNGKLNVSNESYRVIILPAMQAVRFSMLHKIRDFHQNGGIVIALGDLPIASERVGRDDPEIDSLLRDIFGPDLTGTQFGIRLQDTSQVAEVIHQIITPDYSILSSNHRNHGHFIHRKIGARDIYFLYAIPRGTIVRFRSTGRVEKWNPWTGKSDEQAVIAQAVGLTSIRMNDGDTTPYIIIFQEGSPNFESNESIKASQQINLDGTWEFELKPTLDNRYGDYNWPASDELLGSEIRQIKYQFTTDTHADFSSLDSDDASWPKVTQSFGPMLWKLGPLPDDLDTSQFEEQLKQKSEIDSTQPVVFDGKSYSWTPYSFSWRWGLEGDPGHQGYHGLKNQITDEFIALGKQGTHKHSKVYLKEETGTRYYLWTTIHAGEKREASILTGGSKPSKIWVDGQAIHDCFDSANFKKGSNPLLVRYDQPGRSFVVVGDQEINQIPSLPIGSLKMRWFDNQSVLPFDLIPGVNNPIGWYRFKSPPGLHSMTLSVIGQPTVWVDGKQLELKATKLLTSGESEYEITLNTPKRSPVQVAIRINHQRGIYAGAALTKPIQFKCGKGEINTGDWSLNDGLHCYSGGAWYRKNVVLDSSVQSKRNTLDLGLVNSTAEIFINGTQVGVLVAPPWKIDISGLLIEGDNRIEVLVYSTLGNHYTTIPSMAPGSAEAGMLGPVKLILG